MDRFTPTRKLSRKVSLPWITQEIKRLIRKRDSLYIKHKKNKKVCDRNHFLKVKHLIKSKIKQAYHNYLEDILGLTDPQDSNADTTSKFSSKKLFSLIKNSRQDSQGIAPLKAKPTDSNLYTLNKDKANILNRQFQSVFTPVSPLNLSQLCDQALDSNHANPSYPAMPEIKIDRNGILKLLFNLRPGKAAGPDQLKPIVLKELRNEIAPIIELIFTLSLSSGQVPREWTSAIVCPLYKKSDKSDPANYRPISLTCILCKVMEHIVASNLTKHLSAHDILYDLQHGFREKRSCETQLIQLVDDLSRKMVSGHQVDLILLDFSKAFDKVSHSKLLYKLQKYGVKGTTLQWINAFLSDRTQSVVLEGEESEHVSVTSGVPQGSVLGPLLFLVYINDLPDNIKSQVRLFADDTAVYITVNNTQDSQTLQHDLDLLQKWEATWEMDFNPSKCQVLHISRSKHPVKCPYTLHGQTLEVVDHAKYLGVDISSNLSWNHHINRTTTSAGKTLGFLRRNIKTRREDIKQCAYKTLVRPQVEYASTVWSPHTQQSIHKVEMIQRRAIRWVKHNYSTYDSVTQMQESLGWRSLEQRRADAQVTMFYKIIHGLVAVPLPAYIEHPKVITRHMHPFSYRQIHAYANYYKYSFFPRAIVLWNRLPLDIVVLSDLDSFKRGVCRVVHPSY